MSDAAPRDAEYARRPASERSIWARTAGTLLVATCAVLPAVLRGGVDPETFVGVGAVGAVALALVTIARRREGFPFPPAGVALAGGALLALLSAVPMPAALVSLLSPRAVTLASLPPEAPARFVTWSLDPAASLNDAARLAGLAALVFAAAALARRERTAERLSMSVAAAGLMVLTLSVAHAVASVDGFLGIVPPSATALLPSPFINPNHAASLFILSASAAAGLAAGLGPGIARFGWGTGALACAAAAVATESIGGALALVIAAAFLGLLVWARRRQASWPSSAVMAPGLAVLAVAAVVLPAGHWIESLGPFEAQATGKSWPWPGTLRLIAAHPLTGVGRGAYEAAFQAFAPSRLQATVTHPETVLLHWAAEWGILAAIVGVAALCLTWGRAVRDRSGENLLAYATDGLLAGTVAVFFHDFVDFGLEFAGVGAPFAVALGVLSAVTPRVRWPAWSAMPVIALALVAAEAGREALPRLAPWELENAPAPNPDVSPASMDAAFRAIRRRHPADPFVTLHAANGLLGIAGQSSRPREERQQGALLALPHLARSQELATHETPHVLTAKALLMLGRRPQAMTEFRLAFQAGGLSTRLVDALLATDVNAAEIASIPPSLQQTASGDWTDRLPIYDPTRTATLLIHRLRELGRPSLAADTSLALLEDPAAPWSVDGEFLMATCRAFIAAAADPQSREARAAQLGTIAERYRTRAPDVADPYWCASQAHVLGGRRPEAEAVLRAGLEATGGSSLLTMALAHRLLADGRHAEMIPLLAPLADPPTSGGIAELRGMRVAALRGAGRPQRALAAAKAAADEFPDEPWSRALYAGQLVHDGSFAKAAEEAHRAADLSTGPERERLLKWSADLAAKAATMPPAAAPR